MRIMIVDDAAWVHSAIKLFLMTRGDVELIDAFDAYDALKKLGRDPHVDLILLDFNMPKVNGLQFLKNIKSQPDLRRIPVVLSTTEKIQGDVADCLTKGAAELLRKPYTVEQLQTLIARYEPRTPGRASV